MIGCLRTQALAFLAVFVYATHATHATQAIAFEWKPGLSLSFYHVDSLLLLLIMMMVMTMMIIINVFESVMLHFRMKMRRLHPPLPQCEMTFQFPCINGQSQYSVQYFFSSSHGIFFLSVAASHHSRLVAFFHADDRPIISGFKSASVARSQVWLGLPFDLSI